MKEMRVFLMYANWFHVLVSLNEAQHLSAYRLEQQISTLKEGRDK